jgi:hypothetical protein
MQIIQFPGKPKPAAQLTPALGPRRSKDALLKAARATCANQSDAIFVLIEAHRNAWHQWSKAVDVEADPYDGSNSGSGLPAYRRIDFFDGRPSIVVLFK